MTNKPEAPRLAAPSQNVPEKRAWVRYNPDPLVPVMFQSPRSPQMSAGDIVDISEGGLRLQAPPASGTPLLWGDVFKMTVAYSESNRKAGIEGLELEAIAVEIISNARSFLVRARFQSAQVHDRLQEYIGGLATETGPNATVDFAPRRSETED